MSANPRLSLRDVGKVYANGTVALSALALDLEPGETIALVGESGCGKSTLLRLVNRLHEPTSGTILLDGLPLAERDPVALRRQVGYVPQEGGLLPHWTVSKNVRLVPRLLGWTTAQQLGRAEELLDAVGLDPALYGERRPQQLSGGERQRVALARALAGRPELVLLDEPFGALDALTRNAVQRQLAAVKERFAPTMLLVTHDLVEAFLLGDRIGVLRAGRLHQLAAPAKLLENPETPYVAELLATLPATRASGSA